MALVGTVFQGYSGLNSKAFDSDWRYTVIRIQVHVEEFYYKGDVKAVIQGLSWELCWSSIGLLGKKNFPPSKAYLLNFPTKSPYKAKRICIYRA